MIGRRTIAAAIVVALPFLSSCSTETPVAAAEAQSAAATFVSATVCSDCHTRLYEPGVRPNWDAMSIVEHGDEIAPIDPDAVGPFSLWSGTMMAHAAQDPYWRAKVRFEARTTPDAAAEIENACLSCHAPAQQYAHRFSESPMRLDELAEIGLEGVTCTSCHQISPENLGDKESFTAGFTINQEDRIYGPHADPFPMPMRMHTGKTPTQSAHMLESALCGTCHTVITPTLNAKGERIGEFVEQGTYLEWLTSSYPAQGETCQSCHMPRLADENGTPVEQYIAHTPHGGYFGPTSPRKPFGRHSFQGANAPMLDLLAEIFPEKSEILKRSAERARDTLAGALEMSVSGEVEDGALEARVQLINKTGHKLPSGFPSRRLWLHVTISDAAGNPIFESGAYDASTGRLKHEAQEPHYDVIDDPSQTLIYESEMGGANGAHTVSLMRAARFVKDNRLLPAGFGDGPALPAGVDRSSIAPVGVQGDPNFGPGRDEATYCVDVGDRRGPFRIEVEALYQTFKPSHTQALSKDGSAEEARFLALIQGRSTTIQATKTHAEVRRRR